MSVKLIEDESPVHRPRLALSGLSDPEALGLAALSRPLTSIRQRSRVPCACRESARLSGLGPRIPDQGTTLGRSRCRDCHIELSVHQLTILA